MANGKPGDNPLTDLLYHGGRPFPPDLERMIRRLNARQPSRLHELGLEPFEWERGVNLEKGRAWLREALRAAGDADALPTVSWLAGRCWRIRFALRRFSQERLRRWLRPVLRRAAKTAPPPDRR